MAGICIFTSPSFEQLKGNILKRILIALMSWIALAFPVLANVQHTENIRLLERYFELAGVEQLLASVPTQIESMYYETVAEQGDNAADSQILAALFSAWDQKKIKAELMANLAIKLEKQKLQQLLSWQNGQLAQSIKQLDLQTEQEAFALSFQEFALKIPQSLPAKDKMALINEVIDSKQMVDSMVELTLSVSEPVMAALLASPTALTDGFDRGSINEQLAELKVLLESDLSQQISLLSYFLYKDVADKDLQKYAAFYQSELGRLELEILSTALHQSIALWQEEYHQNVLVISPQAWVTE